MTSPTENTEELREQLVAGGYRLDTNGGTERTIKFIEAYADQAVQAFGEKVKAGAVDSDRIYTNEHDRKLWNEFKELQVSVITSLMNELAPKVDK